MTMRKNFIYTQTRLQARHGMRANERIWGLVESQKDLANYLQSVRQSSLGHWVTGLQASDDHHALESQLLKNYRNYVMEVAAWVPPEWRKAVEWVTCLTYLPIIRHLTEGNTAYRWMLDDNRIKLATTSNLENRMGFLLQSEFAALFRSTGDDKALVEAWLEQWQHLWPGKKSAGEQRLTKLVTLLRHHREVFGQLDIERTWRQRQHLRSKLNFMFRRFAYDPAAVFIHLLLVALDIERIRGAVMQRSLFRDSPQQPDYVETGT